MQRGFTLVELLTVVTIIGGVTSLGLLMYARIARGDKAPAFARSILALVHEARQAATSNGRTTRITVDNTNGMSAESHLCTGTACDNTPTNWTSLSMLTRAPSDIELCTPRSGVILTSAAPTCGGAGGIYYFCFRPDGFTWMSGKGGDCTQPVMSNLGATLSIHTTDLGANNNNQGSHHYKVIVWGLTGMPKLIDTGYTW
jgi:prepilin-type N-terminal cleavage/methylation domain-containing protein